MSTDRITLLQSLLERVKRNAALPRRFLGSNLVFGGTPGTQTDVVTGPALPIFAVPQSAPVAAGRSPTLSGAARVPTMSGAIIPLPPLAAAPPKTQVPAEVIEELDFDDSEAVDVTSDRPPPAEISSVEASPVVSVVEVVEAIDTTARRTEVAPVDELRWTEPPQQDSPPDSSPRPRAAASLDEALAEAAEDSDSVMPLKTPPPESGRQPMDGVYSASMPDTTPTDMLPLPTVEQLGETLDLEAPTSANIELDLVVSQVQTRKEELEFELPLRPSALELPAHDELPTLTTTQAPAASSQRRTGQPPRILVVPDDGDTVEMAAIEPMPDIPAPSTDRGIAELQAEVTARSAPAQTVAAEVIHAARRFTPRSFAELLDASLKLGG